MTAIRKLDLPAVAEALQRRMPMAGFVTIDGRTVKDVWLTDRAALKAVQIVLEELGVLGVAA